MSEWIPVCPVDDVDEEDVVPFEHDGTEYALYRLEGDEFYASQASCTHEEGALCDGLVMDGVIECPKHNGRFDVRTGKALGAPVIIDLTMYPAKVVDGRVHVDLAP